MKWFSSSPWSTPACEVSFTSRSLLHLGSQQLGSCFARAHPPLATLSSMLGLLREETAMATDFTTALDWPE